jgi:hypothetical protein
MNFLKGIKIFAFWMALVFIIGCAGTPIKFGGNDHDPNFDRTNVDYTKGREITASASGFQLLLIIPININNRHEQAYQQLREMAGRDYITYIKIEESWTYAFVGTIYTTAITAMAYPHKAN